MNLLILHFPKQYENHPSKSTLLNFSVFASKLRCPKMHYLCSKMCTKMNILVNKAYQNALYNGNSFVKDAYPFRSFLPRQMDANKHATSIFLNKSQRSLQLKASIKHYNISKYKKNCRCRSNITSTLKAASLTGK